MSANNIIFIKRKTYEVYYQLCADNDDLGELIGKGKNIGEAVDIATQHAEDYQVEYGIKFI